MSCWKHVSTYNALRSHFNVVVVVGDDDQVEIVMSKPIVGWNQTDDHSEVELGFYSNILEFIVPQKKGDRLMVVMVWKTMKTDENLVKKCKITGLVNRCHICDQKNDRVKKNPFALLLLLFPLRRFRTFEVTQP